MRRVLLCCAVALAPLYFLVKAPEPPSPSWEADEEVPVEAEGRCGAEFLKPPCDMFKFIDHDMGKWKDQSVLPSQVMLSQQKPLPDLPIDRKEALLGSFKGQVFLVYSNVNAEGLDKALHTALLPQLLSIAEAAALEGSAALDVEFVAHTSDLPLLDRKKPGPCTGRFVFSSGSGPQYCDATLPPGVRPEVTRIVRDSDMPYAEKLNVAFWRGGARPANRCGDWRKSPRFLMPMASREHPDVINASVSGTNVEGPPDLLNALAKLMPQRVPSEEQFKYRFLATTAPRCSYTGRVLQFFSSNSVVAMFSNGRKAVAQVAYAAFQENVHFKFLHVEHFIEEIRQMQKNWRALEALPRNARRRWDWLTSHEVRRCYLYELLMAYSKKLAYQPSKSGTIKAMLKRSRPDTTQKPYVPGATVRTFVTYYGELMYLEILNLTRGTGNGMGANLTQSCAKVRQEMPKP